MRLISSYIIGLIFGIGISISGMGNPAKVVNFFDVAGTWDPSLAFVMAGAVVVTFIGYKLVLARPKPVQEDRFYVPTNSKIDTRLIGGSLIFGVGWGISGFCPGAALPVVGTFRVEVLVFVAALLAGVVIARILMRRTELQTAARASS